MYIDEETVSEIRAAVERIQRLSTEIQGKVQIEMLNVWAKKETNQKLQEVREACGWIAAVLPSYDTQP